MFDTDGIPERKFSIKLMILEKNQQTTKKRELFLAGDTLLQAADMIPILLQSLEKASSQSTQSQLVTEAVSAANLLVKLSLVDIHAGE